ncbi:MAG: hypothetical protein R3A48_23170 [Polyangiales bacterium]
MKLKFEFAFNRHTSHLDPAVRVFLDERRTPGNVADDIEVKMKQQGDSLVWKGECTSEDPSPVGMFVRAVFEGSSGAIWILKVSRSDDGKDVVVYDNTPFKQKVQRGLNLVWARIES